MLPDQSLLVAAAVHDMSALLEFSRILNECDAPVVIYNNVILSLMGKLGLGRAAVALPDGEGRYKVAQSKGGAGKLEGIGISWEASAWRGLVGLDQLPCNEDTALLAERGIEQIMAISSGHKIFALLLLGRPMVEKIPPSEATSYTLLIGAIAAMALEGCQVRGSLHDANRRLERRVHRLRSLFEAVREFNALLDRGAILRLLGYTLMGEMTISRFAVAIRERSGYYLVVNHRFSETFPPEVLKVIAEWGTKVFNKREGLDEREATLYDLGVRATIPMEVQGTPRGLLLVGERLRYEIDEEDVEYLSSLANLAISALENARLLVEIIGKERMEEDLRIAAGIQQGLLPSRLPAIDGFGLAAQTIPTQAVGGDCYDTIELAAGRVLISIADVSGKGTPASLLMANVQAAVRALAGLDLPLDELVSRINDVIYQNTSADKFITAFFGVIDPATGYFSYVNAGHNPPLLFTEHGVDALDCGGVILGIMPSIIPYNVGTVKMTRGDLLILYTDGVNEAFNTHSEEYGEARMRDLFISSPVVSASEAVERLRDDVMRFTGDAPQSDDITIVALRKE
jgi:sigma-B regulation protein RsbU (phosphoserine phosphatase)